MHSYTCNIKHAALNVLQTDLQHPHVCGYFLQIYGVKGPSGLSNVPKFDLIRGVAVDYMHCVLLGVTRLLLRLWFSSTHHKELYYIGKHVSRVDERLCSIRPPDEFPRTPRSIEKTLKYWKGRQHSVEFDYEVRYLYTFLPPQLMNLRLGFCTTALLFFTKSCQKNTTNTTYC